MKCIANRLNRIQRKNRGNVSPLALSIIEGWIPWSGAREKRIDGAGTEVIIDARFID